VTPAARPSPRTGGELRSSTTVLRGGSVWCIVHGRGKLTKREKGELMQITRSSGEANPGPSDWFTGSVQIETITAPSGDWRIGAGSVRFAPGARTAWHTHPHGQTIWVTEGVGLCRREGGPVEVIRPGDRVFFEPGENHWHGAAPGRFMTHIAIQQGDERGNVATWGAHVDDEEYEQAPPIDEDDR
jgi:quercetin dioxygenase-like cupin family protein